MELIDTPTTQLFELKLVIERELRRRAAIKGRSIKNSEVKMAQITQMAPYLHLDQSIPGKIDYFYNKFNLKSLRKNDLLGPPNARIKYLHPLLSQNWRSLFPCGDKRKIYYVYAHCDPREARFSGTKKIGGIFCGMPFYVGKGTGNRAWQMNRNQGHGLKLKEILKAGYGPDEIVHLFKKDLSECDALELEAKLIYFFGTIYEEDRAGVLLNLETSKRPIFVEEMDKIKPQLNQNKTKNIEVPNNGKN